MLLSSQPFVTNGPSVSISSRSSIKFFHFVTHQVDFGTIVHYGDAVKPRINALLYAYTRAVAINQLHFFKFINQIWIWFWQALYQSEEIACVQQREQPR